jgi:hypothetical protein
MQPFMRIHHGEVVRKKIGLRHLQTVLRDCGENLESVSPVHAGLS